MIINPGDVHPMNATGIPVSILRSDLDEIEAELSKPDTPQMVYFRRAAPGEGITHIGTYTGSARREAMDRAGEVYDEKPDDNPAAPCNTSELRLPTSDIPRPHSHYFKPCPFPSVDVYRVLKMFDVSDPCLQHAIKKLLCTGNRGHKSAEKDVQDAIDSLTRWQGMRKEEQV